MKKKDTDYTPHFLTLVPGGKRLDITYESGETFRHNNCHHPEKYVKALLGNPEVGAIRHAFYEGKPIYFNGKFNLS